MGTGCIDLTSRSSFCEPLVAMGGGSERRPSPVNARTPPNCARCRNHDQIFPLKGHKRYCKFINCNCEKCQLTAERQKVMARQTAVRRAEEQDRQRMRSGLPVPATNDFDTDGGPGGPRSPVEPDDSRSSSGGGGGGGGGGPASPPRQQPPSAPVPVRPVPHQPQTSNSNSNSSNDEVWRSILTLLNDYKLPINTTPFLHIILNRVTSNTEEVYKLYLRAQEELEKTSPMREEARRPVSSPPLIHPLLSYPMYPAAAAPIYPHRQATHYGVPPAFIAAHSARFSPYQIPVPSLLRHSTFRPSDYIDYTLHERPGVLLPAECRLMYRPDEHLEIKPVSPSNSDKSSFSGSVDI